MAMSGVDIGMGTQCRALITTQLPYQLVQVRFFFHVLSFHLHVDVHLNILVNSTHQVGLQWGARFMLFVPMIRLSLKFCATWHSTIG